jgi:glutathione synthase/RimK-type ligase-like ATP-grasp enzyme
LDQQILQYAVPLQESEIPASDFVVLLFEQACQFEVEGRLADAEARYDHLLSVDPSHIGALNNLGNLLLAAGRVDAAHDLYQRAVAADPSHLASRANLGNTLLKQRRPAEAAEHFAAALQHDPRYRPAHAGLSFAFAEIGDPESAAHHRREAFAGRAIVTTTHRGEGQPIAILELVSTMGGNLRSDPYLGDRIFNRILVATEFFESGTPLPPHQLVFNAVGEADIAAEALEGAARLVAETSAPVINPPDAVRATGRCHIASRLGVLPGVRTARTVLLPRDQLASAEAGQVLASHGLAFPLLLRTPGAHGGEHFLHVRSIQALPRILDELPGAELLAMEFLDSRSPDGKYRKYRVMMIDGKLFPLHLAISHGWKIHYFSADMAENPEHREEDAAFLADMAGVLGPAAIDALEHIAQTLSLDYGGIDFSLSSSGEILVFEANATMTVPIPDPDPRWDYRRAPVQTIFTAVREMLQSRAIPRQGTNGN